MIETRVIPLNPDPGAFLEATEVQKPEIAWMEYDYWKPGAGDEPKSSLSEDCEAALRLFAVNLWLYSCSS